MSGFIRSININMSEHYQKYRNTIRKVARRHRRLKDKWINEQLREKSCKYCGESEIVVLKFYPDDRKIRSESQKISLKEDKRNKLIEQIEDNVIVCHNCYIKLDNDLIDEQEFTKLYQTSYRLVSKLYHLHQYQG